MKKALVAALSLALTGNALAQTDEDRELSYNEKSVLSVGLVSFDSSDFEGHSVEFETSLLKLGKTKLFGEKSSFYGGARYITGSKEDSNNSNLTESEVYFGFRMNIGGDGWIFLEDGYLEQKLDSANGFTRATSSVSRFGIEDIIFKKWLPSKSGDQDGISIRAAVEKYNNFDEDYEGYRIDLGYKSPVSIYYKNSFSGDELIYGINFTHVF